MKIIDIDDNSLNEILYFKQSEDEEFINRFWEYTFFSVGGKRSVDICPFCNKDSHKIYEYQSRKIDTRYEKNGISCDVFYRVMFIPKNDNEIYRIPGRVFHYFFTHKFKPKEDFRNCVMKYSIYDKDYRNIVRPYLTYNNSDSDYKKCEKCGSILNTAVKCTISKYKGEKIISYKKDDYINNNESSRMIANYCFECMHQNLMLIEIDDNGKVLGRCIVNVNSRTH